MNIYNDVYQLLKDNDCVIIPGFGGFIANYFEAKTDLKKQEFFPPSRKVAFNENLQNNDGLLINYICNKDNTSWNIADNYVQKFVVEINDRLKNGETVKFERLGQFSKTSGILVFVPNTNLNLLEESYGLTGFNFPMLKSAKSEIETKSSPAISKTKSAKLNKARKSRKPLWTTVSVAAVVGGLAFMSVYFGIFDLEKDSNINYTNVIPVEIVGQKTSVKEPVADKIEITKEVLLSEEELTPEKITEEVITAEEPEIAEPEVKEVIAVQQRILAYTIAGSFSNYSNAENMQNELTKQGYSSIILPLYNGLYRVTVKSYDDRNVAINELESLRTILNNPNMWVLYM